MKKVYIVHCWGGSSQGNWIPWLKSELEKRKFQVIAFDMPNTENPTIKEWVEFLKLNINNLDENIYFIGHSIGCQTIMRYLEQSSEKTKIGGALFIAGWFNLDNLDNSEILIAKKWIETPIHFNKIKNKVKKIEVIISRDEPYGFVKENSEIFRKELNANVYIENGFGHFIDDKMPIILTKFLKIAK